MSFNLRAAVLLFTLIIVGNMCAYAQSVRGKVIYVSSLHDVKLKFRSAVSNYSFVNKSHASSFKIKLSGSRNFQINSVAENFKSANLVITEGSNTHLFILAYKSSLDASTETVYDFSSKERLEQETQKMMARKTAAPVQNIQVKNTAAPETKTIVTQAVVTEVPERPQVAAPAEPENNKHITSAAIAPAKANTETVPKPTYSSEIANATAAYRAKDYVKAKAYFQSAQKLNPSAKYPGVRISELNVLIAREKKNKKPGGKKQ